MPLILITVVVLVGLWIISTYNFFVSSKGRITAAIQEIGNQLKRQAEMIPNLEESAKGYLKHEKDIFKMLTEARKAVSSAVKSGDLQKMSDAGEQFASILPRLSIAVEDNPELQASGVVSKLMDELRDTSDKIMYARRLVIDLTADYNIKRVTIPSSFVANMFHFESLPGLITPTSGEHLEVGAADVKTPKVKLD